MQPAQVPPIQFLAPEQVLTGMYVHYGIYGRNGTGKTTLLSTVPKELPMLVVSADQENVKPLIGRPNTRVAVISLWEQLAQIYDFLRKGLLLPNGQPDPDVLSGRKPFFRVLAFDTWSRMQGIAANKVIGYQRMSPEDAMKFISVAPKTARGYDAWQQIGALAGEWMRYFEELPIHCIFLFQEGIREIDGPYGGKLVEVGPLLTPLAAQHAKDTLEIVGRLYVETADEGGDDLLGGVVSQSHRIDPSAVEVRKLLIGQEPPFFAKGPTHKLGRVIEDPTWEKLTASLS